MIKVNIFLALSFFFFSIIFTMATNSPTPIKCDESKWTSQLISTYNVSLVLTVYSKGCGNFTNVQDAVNAVPDSSPHFTLITIESGTYREKVKVNDTKTNLIIEGKGYLNTFIQWDDYSNRTGGTFKSYSFGVFAAKFTAYNISFKNTAPHPSQGVQGAQAVALRIHGDQAAFYGCGFYGAQDTLHDDQGRHYFKECVIQGSIDFIFGNARSLYEDCTISSIANPNWTGDGGYITAHRQESLMNHTGFSFMNCHIIGSGKVLLGRPWKPFAKVVFSRTYMSNVIATPGWSDKIDNVSANRTIFFAEYDCKGPGAVKTSPPRAFYAKQLNDSEAAPYLNISYIDGTEWLRQF